MEGDVILTKLEGLRDLTEERFRENASQHAAVIAQVTKTNGRVRLLEKSLWGLGGAITILSFMASVVLVPVLIKMFIK